MTKIIIPLHRCTEVEDCPTVRRHPRTLHGCDAAFPGDPEYSAVVERPVSGGYSISWWLALLIVSALGAIAIVFGGPSD